MGRGGMFEAVRLDVMKKDKQRYKNNVAYIV